jgi:ribonuclease P/MRP protein subunit POP5
MRGRRRYMAFLLESEGSIGERDLLWEIYSTQANLLGDIGSSKNLLKLIRFDGRFGILRCNHTRIKECRAALACVYAVGGIRVSLTVLGISGTIRALTEKYIPELGRLPDESDHRRIEIEGITGSIARIRGDEIDLSPDDQEMTKGSDTRYLGLTSFDLYGECDYADGTSDGL